MHQVTNIKMNCGCTKPTWDDLPHWVMDTKVYTSTWADLPHGHQSVYAQQWLESSRPTEGTPLVALVTGVMRLLQWQLGVVWASLWVHSEYRSSGW